MTALLKRLTTFFLRSHKHDRISHNGYTNHELWDMGFHDGIWHSKPDKRFEPFPAYRRGWKYSKDN